MFLASGAAGLIYEITWTRLLSYVFGTGTYALSAVVVAYMGGLALGAGVAGRRSDRITHPLLVYAALEVGIAFCGVLLPYLLQNLSVIDSLTYALGGGNFLLLTTGRFFASIGVLLLPTALMGATLPILAAATVETNEHLGRRVALLYSINALGAVAGALAAGFLLIPEFGMGGTTHVAIGLNIASALVTFMLWFMGTRRPSTENIPETLPNTTLPRSGLLVVSVAAAGFASLGCQILWYRSLPFTFEFLSSTTYCYSALLGVFIAGLALGGGLAAFMADRQARPTQLYGTTLLLIGLSIMVSLVTLLGGAGGNVFGFPLEEGSQDLNLRLAAANIIAQTALVIGVPTLLMGMALPLAVRAFATVQKVGAQVGNLYAVNTLGGIVGILLVTFLLIPTVGVTTSIQLMAILYLCFGFAILFQERAKRTMVTMGVLSLLIVIGMAWVVPFGGGFRHIATAGMQEIHYQEGPVATIGVYEDVLKERYVHVDGHGVAGTPTMMQTDQKSLAHLPMMLVDGAQRALTVGFGSGGASYSFLQHPELERVACVEIAPEIQNAAPHLEAANHNFLEEPDPRYHFIEEDARAYLQYTDVKYDIIATDCTDLRYKLNANLYDREYFEAARKALSPQGIVVVWMPLGGLSDSLFRLTLRTFKSVFPETAVFYMHNVATEYVLLVGWRNHVHLDFDLFKQRLSNSAVRQDLAEIYLDDPFKMLATFVTAGERLDQFVSDGPLNTQDTPILEFEAPRHGYNDDAIMDNLNRLLSHRESALQWIEPESISRSEREQFLAYQRAVPSIVRGLFQERKGNYLNALQLFRRAQVLTPEDRGLTALLNFPVLKKWADLGNVDSTLIYASLMTAQGRGEEASDSLTRTAEVVQKTEGIPVVYRQRILDRIKQFRTEFH